MRKLPYFKPFLTFEEQARLLEERGLLIANDENRNLLVDFLRSDNTDNTTGNRQHIRLWMSAVHYVIPYRLLS